MPTLILIASVIIAIAWCLARWIAREKPRPEIVTYGDVIALPAAAMNAGGRRQIRSDGLRTKDEIAPHQIGASR